jgi:hypothetical protein
MKTLLFAMEIGGVYVLPRTEASGTKPPRGREARKITDHALRKAGGPSPCSAVTIQQDVAADVRRRVGR